LPRRAISRLPQVFRLSAIQAAFSASVFARDIIDLLDAVCRVTGKEYCVDSSKSAFRYRALYKADPARTLAVILVRDYRAVVHSKIKHGKSLTAAARRWRSKMRQIEALTQDVPARRKFELKYESLCENPEAELRRLCDFIGVEFSSSMLQRPSQDVHHIGGSPSKFDPQRARISLDHSADGAFQAAELEQMRRLVGPMAERWGY
jgi:Sulfotransferase family